MTRFAAIVDRLSHVALLASTALVVYLMATQTLEVVLRWLGRPTTWVFDLNLVAIIGVVFLGLAGAEQARENVAVEFLSERFTGRTREAFRWVNGLLALLLLALLAWFGTLVVFESLELARTTGGLFPIPSAIPEATLPIGAVLLGLQIIADLSRPERIEPTTDGLEAETAAGDLPA